MSNNHPLDIHSDAKLLLEHAVGNITAARRTELLDWLFGCVEKDNKAVNSEEQFFALYSTALIVMLNYCNELQAKFGGEILEREMGQ